jgi:hypothetical protein
LLGLWGVIGEKRMNAQQQVGNLLPEPTQPLSFANATKIKKGKKVD